VSARGRKPPATVIDLAAVRAARGVERGRRLLLRMHEDDAVAICDLFLALEEPGADWRAILRGVERAAT
jgi:hypothetical protein